MFWWVMKWVLLGPLLRLLFRPKAVGLEHVPSRGPAILAANHVSPLDTVLLPLVVPRRKVVFLAKAEYFEKWYMAWFFRQAGSIPVERRSARASGEALEGAVRALAEGKLVGIFPEGTRSPDGRLYRGRTGVARLALRSGAPVVPVGLFGTYEAMPYNRRVPRPRATEVRFGPPVRFERIESERLDVRRLREVTDGIMDEIRAITRQESVNEYASQVKERLRGSRGDGGG